MKDPVQKETSQKVAFLSFRDYVISPLVEIVLFSASFGASYFLYSRVQGVGWIGFVLIGYFFLVILTLITLKLLRVFYPMREGVFTVDQNPWEFYLWSLYGFLCIMNLHLLYVNSLLPAPLQAVFYRLMGMKIGSGTIVNGTIGDPHLITVGCNVVLGADCNISPHAIVRVGNKLALIIRKIRIEDNVLIGSNTIISPGVTIAESSMVNAMSFVPMGAQIGANELWSGSPAGKKRDLT